MLPSSINTHNAPINIPPTSPASNINAVFCKTPIYKQIQKLTQLMSEDKGINAIMNCDEYHIPINHKDPNILCENIAKIFDITQSPNLLRFERLCLSTFKESTFLLKEYTENLVLENIEQILSKRTI